MIPVDEYWDEYPNLRSYFTDSQWELLKQEDVKECLSAYGCNDYVDMLGNHDIPGEWFPVYAYADILTTGSEAGLVWKKMDQVKREYLPRLVMTEDFDSIWEKYMECYESVHPEIFFAEMQKVVDERTGNKSE